MPKIIAHNSLTGQVGSVLFERGEAHTDDERMVAYFTERSGEYDVLEDAEPAEPGPAPEPPADPAPLTDADYDALTDEQVAEAYAVSVPDGNATSRKGQLRVLKALAQATQN